MPTIPLHPPDVQRTNGVDQLNSVPSLLRTPLGLAIMEIQGHVNVPSPLPEQETSIARLGRLVFPDFDASTTEISEGPWMKKVYFYIGHQRMLGQVKKLPKALAVIGRKGLLGEWNNDMNVDEIGEQLEVLEIVKWKIVFSSRPEPVGEGEGD